MQPTPLWKTILIGVAGSLITASCIAVASFIWRMTDAIEMQSRTMALFVYRVEQVEGASYRSRDEIIALKQEAQSLDQRVKYVERKIR